MVKLALKIFCRSLAVNNLEALRSKGPLLLVANHPNSFLDAIIIGSQFKETVHFLARGDAFHKPWHSILLRMLNMIPVYRLSEGKENLHLNDVAFRRSKEVLAQNGIVLIFIEGICVHKHELQPFKKGAARIAMDSKSLPGFKLKPIGIAYDSFDRFGKRINLKIGTAIEAKELLPYEDAAQNFRYFNTVLYDEIIKRIAVPQKRKTKANPVLFLPAALGRLLNAPVYYFLKKKIRKKTSGTIFYDSVLFGALLLTYPLYLLLLTVVLTALGINIFLVIVIILVHPLTAWCSVHGRKEGSGFSEKK